MCKSDRNRVHGVKKEANSQDKNDISLVRFCRSVNVGIVELPMMVVSKSFDWWSWVDVHAYECRCQIHEAANGCHAERY